MEKNWYKEWFASEDYLDVYRHRNDEDTDKLISLILGNIKLEQNSKVLDAACGAGRYSIKFAERGFKVTGFDLSDTLLQLAVKEAEARNLDINFLRKDLREFKFKDKFDLIVSLFTSFGYFNTDEENFIFVENAYDMLNSGGYYVLDYLNKTFLENNLIKNSEKIIGGKEIIENRSINNGRVLKRITIRKNGHKEEFLESVKLYSQEDLSEKFSKIGFKAVKVFGDYEGNSFNSEKSERCIIIFQK